MITSANKGTKLDQSAPPPGGGGREGAVGGMLMPGRSYSSDKYGFGMNGQEKMENCGGWKYLQCAVLGI